METLNELEDRARMWFSNLWINRRRVEQSRVNHQLSQASRGSYLFHEIITRGLEGSDNWATLEQFDGANSDSVLVHQAKVVQLKFGEEYSKLFFILRFAAFRGAVNLLPGVCSGCTGVVLGVSSALIFYSFDSNS